MGQLPMNDLLIILPGILGSVLRKDGKDLWAPSISAVSRVLQRETLSRELLLAEEEPDVDDLGDGVSATHLMPDVHLIPGLWKIDGYSTLWRMLLATFAVTPGQVAAPYNHANLFAFPYDWRRDNRAAARQLLTFMRQKLPRWRQTSGVSEARVILIGHSMGGLIARYCLEVLGGWEYCRALFTFGTPHRGAVNALNSLCNGYKMLCADVTTALRSFPSVYQLMPNYRMIQVGTEYRRVEELDGIQGVVRERAQQAQAFHDAIRTAATERRASTNVPTSFIFPVVGTQQPTFQSASILDGRVVPSMQLPMTLQERNIPGGGDGTVPYFSAIPAELAGEFRELFVPELHASLQAHDSVLEQLRQHLARLQSRDWDAILGTRESLQETDQPAISLALDDLYQTGEPVILRAQVVHTSEDPGVLEALLTCVDTPEAVMRYPFNRDGDVWTLTLQALPAGLYRVEVQTYSLGPTAPRAVRDIFEVID